MACDVVYIADALTKHVEWSNLINFGVAPENTTKKRVTASAFRSFAISHNARFKGKRKK